MNDPQDIQRLEDSIHAMQWESVKLEPTIEEVYTIDSQLPDAWLAEINQEQAFNQEVLDPLTTMSDQELYRLLDIPEGDIDTNVREAIQALGIDIDALMKDIREQEIPLDAPEIKPIEQEQTIDRDDDFGR